MWNFRETKWYIKGEGVWPQGGASPQKTLLSTPPPPRVWPDHGQGFWFCQWTICVSYGCPPRYTSIGCGSFKMSWRYVAMTKLPSHRYRKTVMQTSEVGVIANTVVLVQASPPSTRATLILIIIIITSIYTHKNISQIYNIPKKVTNYWTKSNSTYKDVECWNKQINKINL